MTSDWMGTALADELSRIAKPLPPDAIPLPGSGDAVFQGCSCLPSKNPGAFWVDRACPLHGTPSLNPPSTEDGS